MTLLKRSEYQIIEQLRKAPDHSSMLSLILTSETRRDAFLKVLNESHVSDGISADKFADIVGNVSAFNILSFSDEEMGPEGTGHNKAPASDSEKHRDDPQSGSRRQRVGSQCLSPKHDQEDGH